MVAASPQYAKAPVLADYQRVDDLVELVMPFRESMESVSMQSPFECKVFFYKERGEDATTATINWADVFHKVSTEAEELELADEIDLQRADARQQLMEIANYRDNWDGYGAMRPLSECLSHALDLMGNPAFNLEHLSEIYPNPNGTITMEWERDDDEIGLELGSEEFSFYAHFGDNHSYNNQKRYVAEEIERLVKFVSYMQ